jgi:hypothetical protein
MSSPRSLLSTALLALAAVLSAAWIWRNCCLFPAYGWNEIRLAPVFQMIVGGSPYPSRELGPATTWIYGPVPLLLMLPAAWASTAASALVVGASLNAAVALAAILVGCLCWRVRTRAPGNSARLAAVLICIPLWPGTSWRFFQPDNAGVLCALLSLLALQRAGAMRTYWWAAAACSAAILCKQTFVGLLIGQIGWLCWCGDRGLWYRHGTRVVLVTVLGLLVAGISWGQREVAYSLYTLPQALPWSSSVWERLIEIGPILLIHAAVPLAALGGFLVTGGRKDSPLILPLLCWAGLLPLDLAAFCKSGGSVNSLHGLQLILPVAALVLCENRTQLDARKLGGVGFSCISLLALLITTAPGTWAPRVRHLEEASVMARQLPEQILFPWHPLIPFFAEKRLDEVEDGLFIRYLAKDPVRLAQAHLPPRFRAVAYRRGELEWGIVKSLIPESADVQEIGAWTLYSWPEQSITQGLP